MKRRLFLVTAFLTAVLSFTVYAGEFVEDGEGIRYRNDDGTWNTGWFEDNYGSWYCFGDDGYARTGWYRDDYWNLYYFQDDGKMISDRTAVIDNVVVDFDKNGYAKTRDFNSDQWIKDDTGWWYRFSDGTYCKNGWIEQDDKRYYFDDSGYMVTGLETIGDDIYYFDGSGAMVTNEEVTEGNVTYSFGDDGKCTDHDTVWPYKPVLYIPPEDEKSDFGKSVDDMGRQILAEIINDDMSDWEKATAIYRWIKGNVSYSGSSPIGDWVSAAYDGLRRRRGDCYTYYGTSAELLNLAGFQTIEVIRSTDNDHYWNLVNIDGDWYHFDPCPRVTGGDFCLLTDSEIASSSAHIFDHSLYPPTP